MSASQFLDHSFISPMITASLSNGKEGITNNQAVSPIDQLEHEEPVPDFSFFSGVLEKSRLKCDLKSCSFLGKESLALW